MTVAMPHSRTLYSGARSSDDFVAVHRTSWCADIKGRSTFIETCPNRIMTGSQGRGTPCICMSMCVSLTGVRVRGRRRPFILCCAPSVTCRAERAWLDRAGMALLSVAPNAKPPVFRIGEPEELIAGQAKKERDAKRRQLEQRRSTIMKEVQLARTRAIHKVAAYDAPTSDSASLSMLQATCNWQGGMVLHFSAPAS